ncbi:ABC transporter ATP-binding protein, partial [Leucobacter sp. M11]|nr:ABC transporter ATP-binding protein [Leucobacter sp. M11]
DLVAGYRVIRGMHAQGTAASRYRAVSRTALRGTLAARAARAAYVGLSAAIAQLFAAGVALSAGLLAFAGQISAGELVTAAGVAVVLIRPLEALVGTLGTFWAISQASADRLLTLLRAEPNPASLGDAQGPRGAGA